MIEIERLSDQHRIDCTVGLILQQRNSSCEAQHDGVWLSFRGVWAAAASEVTGGQGSDPGGVVPGHASIIHSL